MSVAERNGWAATPTPALDEHECEGGADQQDEKAGGHRDQVA
jgi:hypothetical protein